MFDGQNTAQEQYSCCGNVDALMGLGLDDLFARHQPNGVVESVLRDARNSSIGVVTAGPTVAGQYTYEPFGAATTTYTAAHQPLLVHRPPDRDERNDPVQSLPVPQPLL